MKMMTPLMIIFTVLVLAGCSGFMLTPGEQNVMVKIAARHVGMEIGMQCPGDSLQEIEVALKAITDANICNSETLTVNLGNIISDRVLSGLNDPLLKADCADLLELIQNRIPEIGLETERVKLIQTVARGILQGIEIQENLNDE